MEKVLTGDTSYLAPFPAGVNVAYALGTATNLLKMRDAGAELKVEHELVINNKCKQADWWDSDAWLRARADVTVIVPGKKALVGDWKTGKIYQGADFQLRAEALLIRLLYDIPVVNWCLFYVDQGKTKSGQCDFTKGLDPAMDVLETMKEVETYLNPAGEALFPARKNAFCRWCDWYHDSVHCTESNSW